MMTDSRQFFLAMQSSSGSNSKHARSVTYECEKTRDEDPCLIYQCSLNFWGLMVVPVLFLYTLSCSTCFESVKSLNAGDAERLERKASMAIELSWKKRAEHSLSDRVLSFMKAGLTHLYRVVHKDVHYLLLTSKHEFHQCHHSTTG